MRKWIVFLAVAGMLAYVMINRNHSNTQNGMVNSASFDLLSTK